VCGYAVVPDIHLSTSPYYCAGCGTVLPANAAPRRDRPVPRPPGTPSEGQGCLGSDLSGHAQDVWRSRSAPDTLAG
jgi:hypothetical protein